MPNAYLVIDGQWGSTGKGLLAGKLALDRRPDVVVCNFGPNAGHTFVDGEKKIMTQQLPTGFVSPHLRHLLIGPGAIIDPEILKRELESFPEAKENLRIHAFASVVVDSDRAAEKKSLVHVGSTRKGTAAGAARKASRPEPGSEPRVAGEDSFLSQFCIKSAQYDSIIQNASLVQIESAQGIELSLDRGHFYPFTTGRNVTPERVLDDCAVPLRFLRETCMVLRTFPIRVGNEYDAKGNQIGTSGPVYPDMKEMTWDEISAIAGTKLLERTTVTNKVRRIFSFSHEQLKHALWVTGPATVFLNFCNYLDNKATESTRAGYDPKLETFIEALKHTLHTHGSSLRWLGFGPRYSDVRDLHMP